MIYFPSVCKIPECAISAKATYCKEDTLWNKIAQPFEWWKQTAVFFFIITSHDTLSYSRYSLYSTDALICFHGAAASASAHPSERAPGRQSARRPCAVLCLWREDALRKLAGNQVRGADRERQPPPTGVVSQVYTRVKNREAIHQLELRE